MSGLFHITSKQEWADALDDGELRPPSLAEEGFVHCSWTHQVTTAAGNHFAGRDDLLLLRLDPDAIEAPLVEEDSYGSGTEYPHVYGPIPTAAVADAVPFPCRDDGGFDLPPSVAAGA